MKFFIALFAIVAVASASHLISGYSALGYASPYAYAAPLAYAHHGYAHHVAPVHYAAPAIQSGYVAATRGSLHVAPLPEGPFAASHHINTAPAPGTY